MSLSGLGGAVKTETGIEAIITVVLVHISGNKKPKLSDEKENTLKTIPINNITEVTKVLITGLYWNFWKSLRKKKLKVLKPILHLYEHKLYPSNL